MEEKKVKKNWYPSENGFGCGKPHMVLSEVFHYPENKVFLDQYIVITEDNEYEIYRSYTRYYSEEDLIRLLNDTGYNNLRAFYNILPESNFTPNNIVFMAVEK